MMINKQHYFVSNLKWQSSVLKKIRGENPEMILEPRRG